MELRRMQEITRLLEGGEPVVVVRPLKREGSVPTPAGAVMIVHEDGIIGTVGGGIVEADAEAQARGILGSRRYRILRHAMDIDDPAADGMLCGGRVTLLLEGVLPADAASWREAEQAVLAGRDVAWWTRITHGEPSQAVHEIGPVSRCGGEFPPLITPPASDTLLVSDTKESLHVIDPIVIPDTLLVFGAGHVAEALAPIAGALGFRCVVIDDRADYASRMRFPTAHGLVVDDPADAVASLPSGDRSWAVIMTRGHRDDAAVLARLVLNRYRYIGMMGSPRKKAIIWEQLQAQGIPSSALTAVHCPIGLPIGGTSPQEIAVSIAAELVAVRHGRGAAALGSLTGTPRPDHSSR